MRRKDIPNIDKISMPEKMHQGEELLDSAKSVLDLLAEQAEDLGPEDLSLNVDHYLYRLPKRTGY
jgi:hypothetical protein